MRDKTRVAIVFGGRSAEHEVSLQSAQNVVDAIDRNTYDPVLIGIDKGGRWYLNEETDFLLQKDDPRMVHLGGSENEVALIQDGGTSRLINPTTQSTVGQIDVVFPVLHGPYGEDGTIQGLFRIAGIPFVGADVLGSAVGMDKDVMKRLLRDAGIPIPRFMTFNDTSIRKTSFQRIVESIGCPVFVKPANLGSSVGISKAAHEREFNESILEALQYDSKVIVEEYIEGREIECSVLGNDKPIASVPGEVVLKSDFYSYEAKYIDSDSAVLEIPAKLPGYIVNRIQETAVQVFLSLYCQGMARVDFFLRNDTEFLVNEINTILGFTKISMYPKLWEASGISYKELITRLIELAQEKFQKQQNLKVSVSEEQPKG